MSIMVPSIFTGGTNHLGYGFLKISGENGKGKCYLIGFMEYPKINLTNL